MVDRLTQKEMLQRSSLCSRFSACEQHRREEKRAARGPQSARQRPLFPPSSLSPSPTKASFVLPGLHRFPGSCYVLQQS